MPFSFVFVLFCVLQAFYLSEDEFGPSPHLIDGETGDARSRHVHSSIKPLPSSTKAKGSVPTLQPPSN